MFLLKVIYQLCACSDTSGPTMRYLRTSQDFLFSHLQHMPFSLPSEAKLPPSSRLHSHYPCILSIRVSCVRPVPGLSLGRLSLSLSLSGNQIAALSQMSWLMKTAAIELRMTSLNRQRSHTQRLVSLLLDDQPPTQHTGTPPRTLPRAHTAH